MNNNLRMIMIVAAFSIVLGCNISNLSQMASPAKTENDQALYDQTIEKISKTNDLFALKKMSFDKIRQQQTNLNKPDNKIVCQSLAGWNLIFQDRIGNNDSLIQMRREGKFDAHLSKIDQMIATIKVDLQKSQTNFDQIAGVYKCELSGVRSDGSINFSFSFDRLDGDSLTEYFKNFEDFLKPSDVAAAEDLIFQGYYDAALKKLNEIIKADPKNAAAYTQRAIIFNKTWYATQNKANLDSAIADATKAISIDPQNGLAYLTRGEAYYILGYHKQNEDADKKMAMELANKAIDQNPASGENYYFRGLVFQSKGEHDPANADFTKAIAINPKLAKAYAERGLDYRTDDHWYEALADYNQVIAVFPKSVSAYNIRGDIYRHLGEYDKALADAQRAFQLDPSNPWAIGNVKRFSQPETDDEIITRYKYLRTEFIKPAKLFEQQSAKYEVIAKPQTEKKLVCAALNDLYGAFVNQKAASDKLIFINQHAGITELKNPGFLEKPVVEIVKEAILFNKQIAEFNEKAEARFKEIAVNYGCKL